MPDFQDDALVASAFAAFRAEVAPYVRPIGTAAAHETVRHRKRVRLLTMVAVAAVIVAVPVAASAAGGLRHGPGPVPATGGPSVAPSATASPSHSPTIAAPDGQIPAAALDQATLIIPPWGPDAATNPACPTGPVTFTDGRHHIADSEDVAIDDLRYADVDHDGAEETVVRLSCGGQGNAYQVVALDRDTTGAIVTLGQVTVDSGTVRAICGLQVDADGNIEAEVADFPLPLLCDRTQSPAQFQWRVFGWNGTAFTQVGGPTSFPTNPKVSDLRVTAPDLVMTAAPGGGYRGELTVTVRNAGKVPMGFTLTATFPQIMGESPLTGCLVTMNTDQHIANNACDIAPLAAGASRSITFGLTSWTPVTLTFIPTVSVSLPGGYGDWNQADNRAQFTIKYPTTTSPSSGPPPGASPSGSPGPG